MSAPKIVPNLEGTWPHDVAKEHPDAWIGLTDEQAHYALEVLPPIYFRGGFAVSEAAYHTASGEPAYWCVVKAGDRFYGRDLPISQAPAEAATLRQAVAS